MADSTLERTILVSPVCRTRDNHTLIQFPDPKMKTTDLSSLHLSSNSQTKSRLLTDNATSDDLANTPTKTSAAVATANMAKMAVEAENCLLGCNRNACKGMQHEAVGFVPQTQSEDDKKRRRSDRYDSSESSDSGVAYITCSDASSWSSSSDLTEPVSPASPASSHPSPLGQIPLDNNPLNKNCHKTNSTATGAMMKDAEQKCFSSHTLDKNVIKRTQFLAKPCNSGSGSFISYVKRRRRYSESTSTDILKYHQSGNHRIREQSNRARKLSGEGEPFTKNWPFDKTYDSDARLGLARSDLNWLPFLERIQSDSNRGEIDQDHNHLTFADQRHSWPATKRLHQLKRGQLKITEFFSSQVKQHWNLSKLSNLVKDDKFQNGLKNPNWRLPVSRVAIVSVAQVNQHGGERFNPRPLIANEEYEKTTDIRPLGEDSLSQSTTPALIRFPIDEMTSCHKNSVATALPSGINMVRCLWLNCTSRLTSGQSLLEHIQNTHVASQALSHHSLNLWSGPDTSVQANDKLSSSNSDELYACQWEGCKVQGRTSSSRAWLERHVLLHGGHKPFRCIVDLCEQRFNSQAALQRHVNAHFNQESGQSNNNSGLKRDNLPAKVIRRNSKKLKTRRSKVLPARMLDYFDSGVMERLRHQLLYSRLSQNGINLSLLTNGISVRSQIVARRLDASGKSLVLLKWSPEDVVPDQWVLEEEIVSHKIVSFRNLGQTVQFGFDQLFIQSAFEKRSSKQRRKR